MASHWRMTVDVAKFNTPSQRGSHSQPHQACFAAAQTVSKAMAWSRYQLPARSWLYTVALQFSLDHVSDEMVFHVNML
jgi:hypothetical protein